MISLSLVLNATLAAAVAAERNVRIKGEIDDTMKVNRIDSTSKSIQLQIDCQNLRDTTDIYIYIEDRIWFEYNIETS